MNAERRYALPICVAACVVSGFATVVMTTAARADNPWRAPAKPGVAVEQYAPLEQTSPQQPAPAARRPVGGTALQFAPPPPNDGVARPGLAPAPQNAYPGYNPGYNPGYTPSYPATQGYPGYPGGGYGQQPYANPYAYPGPNTGPYSGPYSGPYGAPGIDPVLRDSIYGPGARGGFMGGFPWN